MVFFSAIAAPVRLLQEVISADQGGAGAAAPSTPIHASYGMLSSDQYNSGMYGSTGAGEWTIWIMLATVSLGYMMLFFFMSTSCFGPRVAVATNGASGFTRFPDIEQPEYQAFKHSAVAELDQMWRKAFVMKVYTLLAVQIAFTIAVSVGMMLFGGYGFYMWSVTDGAWTKMAAILVTFVLLFSMMCYKNAFPLNLVLLFGFTSAMAYTIGMVCTAYAANGLMVTVIEAFAITALLFVALTVFTMVSKIDFSFLGLVLPMLLFTFIIWGFFAMFAFPSFMFSQLYALGGTLIFSLYVLYDTWSITTYLTYDDYVLGAINLYLDFINLFLLILQLLTGMRRD